MGLVAVFHNDNKAVTKPNTAAIMKNITDDMYIPELINTCSPLTNINRNYPQIFFTVHIQFITTIIWPYSWKI